MNKEFIKKIIKIECLRYEAVKEILPDSMKKRVSSFEKDAVSLIKGLAIELVSESMDEKGKVKDEGKRDTKKFNVDFS